MTYKSIAAPINQLNNISKKLNPLIEEFYKTPSKNKLIVVSINSNSHINEVQKKFQIESQLRRFGLSSEQIYIQTIFNPGLAGQVEFHISSSKINTVAAYNGFNSPIEMNLFSDDKPVSPPVLSYKSWFLENYYSYFKTANGRFCKHRTGTVPNGHISVAYYSNLDYPKEFNDLLFEFSKLEEKTAYEDEANYAKTYFGGSFNFGSSGVGFDTPPPATYLFNDKDIKHRLTVIIDENKKNGKYSSNEARDLKVNIQEIIDRTSDYAREVGSNRFYYENPRIKEEADKTYIPYYYWMRRHTNRKRR